MAKDITVTVYDDARTLTSTINEIEAEPGDRIVLQSSSKAAFTTFFTVERDPDPSALPTQNGPFAPGDAIPAIEIPHEGERFVVDYFHVMSDAGWPKIMIRRPSTVGTH